MHYKYTDIKAIVAEILENKKDDGGVKNIYFVGCGGSLGALYPAKTFMERESLTLKSGWVSSNEFVHSTPRDFGKNSIICLACLAGDIDYAGEKTMCALQVAVELLNQTEGYSNYDKFQQGAGMITTVIRKARAHVAQRALDFAEEYKNDSVIYTMGSGAGYGAAYMESICIFMEMQWIHSGTIHTGEFFHGPFEVTDANTPFVIQVSEGSTRELDERCLKFLHTYAKRIEVLDAKELGLSVIDPAVVDYFNHSLFNNVYPIYNHALAETRQHPLTTRRYMWKVAY